MSDQKPKLMPDDIGLVNLRHYTTGEFAPKQTFKEWLYDVTTSQKIQAVKYEDYKDVMS